MASFCWVLDQDSLFYPKQLKEIKGVFQIINIHQLFIVIYAAINPLLAVTIYANITEDLSRWRRLLVVGLSMILLFVSCVLCVYWGNDILRWLGIPNYVVQLGGGILILIVGVLQILATDAMVEVRSFLHKMTATFGQTKIIPRLNSNLIFDNYNKERQISLGLIPLAIPIMLNPTLILVILFANLPQKLILEQHILLILLGICVIQGLALLGARTILRGLGQLGRLTLNRVIGLCLTVIAFEMLVAGIKSIIPIII